jgi:hypothetical protein
VSECFYPPRQEGRITAERCSGTTAAILGLRDRLHLAGSASLRLVATCRELRASHIGFALAQASLEERANPGSYLSLLLSPSERFPALNKVAEGLNRIWRSRRTAVISACYVLDLWRAQTSSADCVAIRPDSVVAMAGHKQSVSHSPETESPCFSLTDSQRPGDLSN